MIVMMLGLQGSGKTACCVREICTDASGRTYFSNIMTKGIRNNILIKPDMIVEKHPIIDAKTGNVLIKKGVPQYNMTVNKDFWKSAEIKYKGLNIIIDEAHSILNSRRSMSKSVQVILDWISLLRRVLGSTESGYGRLYLVTQIERRLDIVPKEMTTQVRFHLCHYRKTCLRCGYYWHENNEYPEPLYECPSCMSTSIKKHSHIVEIWNFTDYQSFVYWKYLGRRHTYYKHYYVTDIESYFNRYDHLQWDNLINEI